VPFPRRRRRVIIEAIRRESVLLYSCPIGFIHVSYSSCLLSRVLSCAIHVFKLFLSFFPCPIVRVVLAPSAVFLLSFNDGIVAHPSRSSDSRFALAQDRLNFIVIVVMGEYYSARSSGWHFLPTLCPRVCVVRTLPAFLLFLRLLRWFLSPPHFTTLIRNPAEWALRSGAYMLCSVAAPIRYSPGLVGRRR